MLLIGIDEAGYGPKIGPLCHGCCAFRCGDAGEGVTPDLWQRLHPSVMRHPAHPGSITVDDSKKIYSPALGLQLLQHGVHAFLECLVPPASRAGPPEGRQDASGTALYQHLLPECDRAKLEEDAWGCAVDGACGLPVGTGHAERTSPRSRKGSKLPGLPPQRIPTLREALNGTGTSVLALGARAMSAKHYNTALSASGNKADVSWNVIMEQFAALLKLARPGEHVHAVIDRQGGRKFYGGRISTLLPNAFTWTEVETPRKSVYRIEAPERTVHVTFMVEGDSSSLPVALGSMAAKLARELCMHRLNAFFRSHAPDLKPTAGYSGDAHRFLKETQALRERLGIKNEELVREK